MDIGASYYPELLPEADWSRDLATVRDLGLSVLRCGEFSWSRLEPRAGGWDSRWVGRFLDCALAHGFRVVWCTPSATPPPRLFDRWPDLTAISRDQQPMPVGIRRNYCPSHAGYRRECARVATRLAREFAAHPAITGWQVDNEIAGDGFCCWCERCRASFQEWLRTQYRDLRELNTKWQTHVWSQHYTRWEQIQVPHHTCTAQAPALRLAWRRFFSDNWLEFYRVQADALRTAGARSVTTNFYNQSWYVPFNQHDWRSHMDVVGLSHYVEDETSARFELALLRGAAPGEKPLWVLEQKAGQQAAQNLLTDDLGRLERHLRWCAEGGAEMAVYWHLRQHSAGCEQEHGAVLRHDGKPTRVAKAIAAAIRKVSSVRPTRVPDDRLLTFSFDQCWAYASSPISASGIDYRVELEQAWFGGACDAWGSVKIGGPEAPDPKRHRIILAPLSRISDAAWAARLKGCLAAGATVVVTGDHGRADSTNNLCRVAPLELWRETANLPEDFEFYVLRPDVAVTGTLTKKKIQGRHFWAVPQRVPAGVRALGRGRCESVSGPLALVCPAGAGRLVIALTALDRAGVAALLCSLS